MSMDRCVRDTASELGLDESDVREIAERLEKYKKRRLAEGRLDRFDEDMRKYAGAEAEKARIAAALRRKAAAINIILRDEWNADVAEMMLGGMSRREAVLAKLVGSYEGITKARKSAGARRNALEGDWLDGMEREIHERLPHVLTLLRDPRAAKPLLDDTVREWRKFSGGVSVTGNRDARTLAEIFNRYAEASRLEANRAGANIGRIDDWGGPQAHDERRMLRAKEGPWVEAILPRLDLERSFGAGTTVAEAREILARMFHDIVTGRSLGISAKQRGERLSPANLARSLEKHRVLHFKSADDWIAYNDQFGRGNVLTGLIDHQRRMARIVANMQVMGPNPQVFLEAFLESQRLEARKGAPADVEKARQDIEALNADLDAGTGAIGKAFAEVMGDTSRPVSISGAQISANIRALMGMAKLGGSVISSLPDTVNFADRVRLRGQGLFEGYGAALRGLFSGRARREAEAIARLIGAGNHAMLGDIHARFSADDNLGGRVSRWQNAFYRLTFQTGWDDRLHNAFVHMTSVHMAEHADRAWAELPEAYRHVLGLHGIDEPRWDVIRQLTGQVGDYRYVLPELARRLPDEAFTPLVEKDMAEAEAAIREKMKRPRDLSEAEQERLDRRRERLTERARRELELDLRSYFIDEAHFGVLKGDDRTRMFTKQGSRPGTLLGEAWRFMMGFKGYPIAYMQKTMLPALRGRGPGGVRDYGAIAHIVAATWVLGYVSMTIKDLLKGRTPKDPTRWETLLAALVQGGGAGLLGDFFFSKRDRFGGGIASDLIGPVPGVGTEAIELWQDMMHGDAKAGDLFHFALNNTPGLNIWWLRAALNYLVLNQIEEWISPGTLRRRERRIQQDFGQRYVVNPTPLAG